MSRVAIVTGAARGIGAATTARLAAEGWRVLAVDLAADDPRLPYALGSKADLEAAVAAANEAAGEEWLRAALDADAANEVIGKERVRSELADADVATAEGAGEERVRPELAAAEERVRAVAADATDLDAMLAVVERAERWGELGAIVANAGVIAGGRPAWELSQDQEDAVVEVCLRGVMVAARAGVPALLRCPVPRSGRFVATASAAASRGLPGLAAYCAAKAGVAGFVRALAADLRGTGVTANAVAPGSTDTPILAESARLYALESAADFAAQQPIERLIDPAEVAATIAFLLGPEAAAITGTTVPVDGGLAI